MDERTINNSPIPLIVFFSGALLIALARTFQRDVFVVLIKSTLLLKTNEDLSKDGEEMSNLASSILLLHFFIMFSFILENKFHLGIEQFIGHLALPAYLIYLLIVTWMFTRLSNSNQLYREIQFYTFLNVQFIGLVYLLILFVDHFQPFIPETRNYLLFIPIIALFVFRILRSTVLALRDRMRWYYIILYFWTLEILPVLAVTKLFFPEIFREWIG